jgi:hypothetical protein
VRLAVCRQPENDVAVALPRPVRALFRPAWGFRAGRLAVFLLQHDGLAQRGPKRKALPDAASTPRPAVVATRRPISLWDVGARVG